VHLVKQTGYACLVWKASNKNKSMFNLDDAYMICQYLLLSIVSFYVALIGYLYITLYEILVNSSERAANKCGGMVVALLILNGYFNIIVYALCVASCFR
jgi:hypothetical protein